MSRNVLPRRPALSFLGLGLLVALAACAPQPQPRTTYDPPRTRVAVLVPLSGANAAIGRSLQQAAEMALFDAGSTVVELIPRDTGGSPGGAAAAMRGAVAQGARYAVGPLTAAETSAASGTARAARVPLLAFTNDAGQAGPGVWTLGITPAQQVRRVMGAAAGQGARRFALAAPDDGFGRALAAAMRDAASDLGLATPTVVLYPAYADMAQVAREVAQRGGGEAVDAVLIGASGSGARELGAALGAAGIQAPPTRVMGTVLWADEATLSGATGLVGATFAAPDSRSRASFEARYQAAYGQRPPRIAAVAYDAALIAARAAARGAPLGGGETHLGVDGPVRLLPDGRVLRGLALYAIEPAGEPRQVEPASSPVPGA